MEGLKNTITLIISGCQRRKSREIAIGEAPMGGNNPIRLQSMTTTNTNDITNTVEQCIRIVEAGAHYVRITAQGVTEAANLKLIKEELVSKGLCVPLIADIHFNPSAAIEAARYVEKIRINPGNYSDKRSISKPFDYSEEEYKAELENAEEKIIPLLDICKTNGVAIRVGVNHGSLSDRIMSRFGDTPLGMAQSAMEFLRICEKNNFHNLVVSMKSSNTRVMVQATRTLVMLMDNEGMNYPLHLGVTEAGEGEDGRIKSAVGIATLLADGIGDTIRVSLTEEPEFEIPVAKLLTDHFAALSRLPKSYNTAKIDINPTQLERRKTHSVLNIGGENVPVVFANLSEEKSLTEQNLNLWGWKFSKSKKQWEKEDDAADFIISGNADVNSLTETNQLPLIGYNDNFKYMLVSIEDIDFLKKDKFYFLLCDCSKLTLKVVASLKDNKNTVLIIFSNADDAFYQIKTALYKLSHESITIPVVAWFKYLQITEDKFTITAAADAGPLFVDGLCNGEILSAEGIAQSNIRSTAFGILQAARERFTKTEFISCPGCGRTLFNLNETLKKIKSKTVHLKGLKIGVMGCIVNGPGEMADADYGYVGAGYGKVTLYKKKDVVKKNIPEENAVDELIELIKSNGDWKEREV